MRVFCDVNFKCSVVFPTAQNFLRVESISRVLFHVNHQGWSFWSCICVVNTKPGVKGCSSLRFKAIKKTDEMGVELEEWMMFEFRSTPVSSYCEWRLVCSIASLLQSWYKVPQCLKSRLSMSRSVYQMLPWQKWREVPYSDGQVPTGKNAKIDRDFAVSEQFEDITVLALLLFIIMLVSS